MHRIRPRVTALALALLLTACAEGGSSLPDVPSTIVDAGAGTTSTTTAPSGADDEQDPGDGAGAADTTTTTAFVRTVEPSLEEPPFEAVTITTDDGVDLFARFWRGSDTAVLYTHEYDASAAGSGGQRPPQSSEVLAPWTWTLADEGYTVLALDTRGHGLSEGSYSVRDSRLDFVAAYEFLLDQGYDRVVAFASGGSAPVMANVSADGDVDLAGLAMLFTPLAETGFDAGTALANVDEPVWLVGIDVGSFGGVTKRLEPKVQNLYERFVYPPVPSGLQFIDVYGQEHAGRQIEFLEVVSG